MADLYTTISGLAPTQQDILEAELFAKQLLEAKYPDIDLREGTALRDLTLRPSAYILAICKKGVDSYLAQNSISGVDDSTDQDVVNTLMGNWFLTRNSGSYAVINARLFFARQKAVTIPTGTSFSPDGSLQFYPLTIEVFASTGMSYDADSNEWYVDIDLQASDTGSSYNLSEGSLLYFSTFDSYFLRAEINYLVTESTDAETNTEFIGRASTSISTRNLINQPSIISNLQSEFNYVPQIVVVGAGDSAMMRDQAKLTFEPETARLASAVSWAAGTVTVLLTDHGFETGQSVVVTGAYPTGYNGTAQITALTTYSFTYPLTSNPGVATTLPHVQSTTAPIYAHLGGYVDVYCSRSVEYNLSQLTLDATGSAKLTGPIFSVTRSSTSAGTDDDTLAASTPVTWTATSYSSGAGVLNLTAPNHGLTGDVLVKVSGISQTRSISAISCVNKVVTVTCTDHGMSTGNTCTVSGVTPSAYNGTYKVFVISSSQFTYQAKGTILTSGYGSSMELTNPLLEGTFATSVLDMNTLQITMANLWAGALPTGTLVTASVLPFTIVNPNTVTGHASSLSSVGNLVTVILPGHGLVEGRYVQISGSATDGYNGTWRIDQIVDGNSFKVAIEEIGLAAASSATVTYTNPAYDVGFSTQQELVVSFGASAAGKTVSMQMGSFKHVDSVQSYLEGSTKVLCADYLARGFNVYLLDFDVVSYSTSSPSTATVSGLLTDFLADLAPGGTLILSDLASTLSSGGITNLQTPIGVNYTFHHRDLVTAETGVISDYLDPVDSTSVFLFNSVTVSNLSI
jgi:hypothetical protein